MLLGRRSAKESLAPPPSTLATDGGVSNCMVEQKQANVANSNGGREERESLDCTECMADPSPGSLSSSVHAIKDLRGLFHLIERHPFVAGMSLGNVPWAEDHSGNAGLGKRRCVRAVRNCADLVRTAHS